MAWTSSGLARAALAGGLAVTVGGALAYGAYRAPAPETAPSPAAQRAEILADPTPPGDAAPSDAAPGLDLVRVAPDGGAVIAGRAPPGAAVTVRAGRNVVAEAEADASGDFVALFDVTPSDAPQTLTLGIEDDAGRRVASDVAVVVLPALPAPEDAPRRTDAAAAEVAAAPAGGAEAQPVPPRSAGPVAAARETEPAIGGAAAEAGAPPEVAATVLLRADEAEVTLADPPEGAGLALASISYGATGTVALAGWGSAGARLRAYVDDRFALDGDVDARGRWRLELADMAAGVYRLRIDELDPDGGVARRIETPFQRDFPEVAARGAQASVTVQPGNNLWTLARLHYGSGLRYTQIHTANQELIRDPDLIYPGQIFVLPVDEDRPPAD